MTPFLKLVGYTPEELELGDLSWDDITPKEDRLQEAQALKALKSAPLEKEYVRKDGSRVPVLFRASISRSRSCVTSADSFTGNADFVPAIQTRVVTNAGKQTVSGTLFGFGQQLREGRLTEINGFHIEAIPNGNMLVTRSRDVPGVIGRIGTILGERGVNISRFHLGRRERGGEAMAVIEIDAPPDNETLAELRSAEQIISARHILL